MVLESRRILFSVKSIKSQRQEQEQGGCFGVSRSKIETLEIFVNGLAFRYVKMFRGIDLPGPKLAMCAKDLDPLLFYVNNQKLPGAMFFG
jgi:hypothetical protein